MSYIPLPVIIWPASMTDSPTTASTRTVTCPARSEWPKVYGNTNGNS